MPGSGGSHTHCRSCQSSLHQSCSLPRIPQHHCSNQPERSLSHHLTDNQGTLTRQSLLEQHSVGQSVVTVVGLIVVVGGIVVVLPAVVAVVFCSVVVVGLVVVIVVVSGVVVGGPGLVRTQEPFIHRPP